MARDARIGAPRDHPATALQFESTRMLLRVLLMLVLVASLAGGLAYAKWRQMEAMQARFAVPQPPTQVAVATVEQIAWQRRIRGTGSLTAVQDVFVTNEVPGIVTALHFDSGQRVAQGAPLMNLDAAVDAAVLAGLVAERRLAELQFERAATLVKDRTLSRSQYDEAAARRARVAADVVAQQAQIAKKTVRAPFAGTLGIRRVDLGEYLAAGSPIVSLQTLSPIYLDSAIPERYLPKLVPGQTVALRVQAWGDERFSGRLVAIEPGVDPATRMVRVRAEFPNADERLRPGMFAEVEAIENTQQHVLVVPATAITYTPYGNSAFVVTPGKDGMTVERRQVETGETRDGKVAVLGGLAAGDQVVAVGQNRLRNGMRVEIVPDDTLERAAAAATAD